MDAIRGIALLGLTAAGCSLLVDTDAGVQPDGAAGPHRIADSAVLIGRDVDSQIRFSADTDGPGSCLSEEVAGCEMQTCIGGEHPLPRPDAGVVSVSTTSGEPPIPRDQPLAVEWTGADSLVAIAIVCPMPPRVQLRCPLPDGLSGEVPTAAMERLPACDGTVNLFTEDRRVVEPGPDWLVRVALRGLVDTTPATLE